jgi:hypothetical protein
MTSAYNPPLNVAHLAGTNGRCMRCGTSLGTHQIFSDDTGTMDNQDWAPGERVIEYEMPNGRTGFADQVTGFCVDCSA